MSFDSLEGMWNAICEEAKTKMTDVAYNAWISDLKPVSIEDGKLIVSIYSDYKRKVIISSSFKSILEECCAATTGLNLQLEIIVANEETVAPVVEDKPKISSSTDNFTFENFIVGQSNEFAHAVAVAVAERPGDIYNPLYIHGNSGVGKTHLILAIKNRIEKKYPGKNVLYMRGEEFTNKFMSALQNRTTEEFHNEFRSVDVLIIDDVHFFANKDSTQEEFFNTFNSIYQQNKQIIITADRPPKEIKTLPERITSRFEGGMVVDMSPPDFETRVGIVQSKAEQLGVEVEKEILYTIAEQIKSNTRQLEGIVKKIYAYKIVHQNSITNSVVQTFIRDVIQENIDDKITVEKIVDEVARTYGVEAKDIYSKRRTAEIAYAREVAMYVISETTMMKLVDIGKKLNKNHSTVVHDIKVVKEIIKKNDSEKEIIGEIIKNIQSQNN